MPINSFENYPMSWKPSIDKTKKPIYQEIAITKAFKVCSLKGLLSLSVGSGTFVSYDALSNAYLLEVIKTQSLIEMEATLPDNASYEPLVLQLKNMLQKGDSEKWFGYGRAGENLWQKDAAIRLMRRGGYEATVDHILFSNGGQNAITATLASLCRQGDRIGADYHNISGYKSCCGDA